MKREIQGAIVRRFWWLGLWGMVCSILLGCRSPQVNFMGDPALLSQVVSGQTIEVLGLQTGTTLADRIRLIGIEAPDRQQTPWGPAAQAYLQELLQGQTIALEWDVQSQDEFGRKLAYVWCNGALVNEQLVGAGYALATSRSPNLKYEQRLLYAQEKARLLGLGIWNPDRPLRQTPANFRQQRS